MGHRNKALEHYNYVTNLFYREMGVDISTSMETVSYTHLDVYKRQMLSSQTASKPSTRPMRKA